MEVTGSDASLQNAVAERPHRTYGSMMRIMLMAAGLANTYWSYALLHTVYIKNTKQYHIHHIRHTRTRYQIWLIYEYLEATSSAIYQVIDQLNWQNMYAMAFFLGLQQQIEMSSFKMSF